MLRNSALIKASSLEPSTPEVIELRGIREVSLFGQGGEDDLDRPHMAEARGVDDKVVVAGVLPIVAVDLADVGGAVRVALLEELPGGLVVELAGLHDRLDPELEGGPEEDPQHERLVEQHVAGAAADDHTVSGGSLAADDLLGHRQGRFSRVPSPGPVGRRPGGYVLRG